MKKLSISSTRLHSITSKLITASGGITGLTRPQDINGIFSAVGTGLTLVGGASVAEMTKEAVDD
jgi:hypothetical protein